MNSELITKLITKNIQNRSYKYNGGHDGSEQILGEVVYLGDHEIPAEGTDRRDEKLPEEHDDMTDSMGDRKLCGGAHDQVERFVSSCTESLSGYSHHDESCVGNKSHESLETGQTAPYVVDAAFSAGIRDRIGGEGLFFTDGVEDLEDYLQDDQNAED